MRNITQKVNRFVALLEFDNAGCVSIYRDMKTQRERGAAKDNTPVRMKLSRKEAK